MSKSRLYECSCDFAGSLWCAATFLGFVGTNLAFLSGAADQPGSDSEWTAGSAGGAATAPRIHWRHEGELPQQHCHRQVVSCIRSSWIPRKCMVFTFNARQQENTILFGNCREFTKPLSRSVLVCCFFAALFGNFDFRRWWQMITDCSNKQ